MQIPLPGEELQLGVGPETGEEYLRIGRVVREALLDEAGIGPAGSVLDIGCGSGRMARHFVDYLKPPGRYVGMDIQRSFIDWCNEHISSASGAFKFHHQDIYNGGYNPEGNVRASEYRFPFEDESFDAVILYSVFTHLLPGDADNYMREISRLLKPGGRVYSTWYLLTPDAEVEYLMPSLKEGQVGYGFPHLAGLLESYGLRVSGYRLGRGNGGESEIWQDLLWLRRADEIDRDFPLKEPRVAGNPGEHATFSGVLRTVDPVANAITVSGTGGAELVAGISRETGVQAHGAPGRLAALRAGQQAHVSHAQAPGGEYEVASRIVVRARQEPERMQGIVEAVDWDTGLITLYIADEGTVSVRFDPAQVDRVAINHTPASLNELQKGQLAGIYTVLSAQAIEALDPPED